MTNIFLLEVGEYFRDSGPLWLFGCSLIPGDPLNSVMAEGPPDSLISGTPMRSLMTEGSLGSLISEGPLGSLMVEGSLDSLISGGPLSSLRAEGSLGSLIFVGSLGSVVAGGSQGLCDALAAGSSSSTGESGGSWASEGFRGGSCSLAAPDFWSSGIWAWRAAFSSTSLFT